MRTLLLSSLSLSLILGAGCASKKTSPSAKTVKSSSGGMMDWFRGSGFRVRPYRIVTLKNGMKVFFIQDDSLPRLSLQGLMKTGLRDEPTDLAGINSMTAAVLDQGTTKRDAMKLAGDFNALGTEFAAGPGLDGTFLSASSLSTDADALLELYAEVLMNPAFTQKEVDRTKSQTVAALRRKVDNPSGYATDLYELYLYGAHPYGRDTLGSLATVNKIRRADVIRHYLANYRPNNFTLAVVGRFDANFERKVAAVFEPWGGREIKKQTADVPANPEQLSLRFVSKKGLQQTQLRLGRIGVTRDNPDYLALLVASEAFGGGFSSRLMQKVRDDLGLTYSISSSVDARQAAGSFNISTFTRNEAVGKALDEILKLYKEFAANGITEEELKSAKAQLIGQYPRGIETADGTATGLVLLDFYGRPLSDLADFPKNVAKLSLKDVNAAISRHFTQGSLKVLVFGDEKAIGTQLKAMSPETIRL
ncbi:MAG: insulinase family protein [Bdellovibrionaceae bacterium]|nr:insulinase family protein [Pseudobdellovibrionaceae bacterium]MBX3033111.1 insulinase family protein [Pseudobdellovibrionaceae bacterium]